MMKKTPGPWKALARAERPMLHQSTSLEDCICGGIPLANHKSAAKRARQSVKREARNVQVKSAVKTFEKKVTKAIENKSAKEAVVALKEFTAKIMTAASKGVLKKETASRKISRLSTRVSKLG